MISSVEDTWASANVRYTPLLLRRAYPRHTAKRGAMFAHRSYRTVQSWIQGLTSPSLEDALRMARESAELRAELVRLLGEWDAALVPMAAGAVVSPDGGGAGSEGGHAGPCAQCSASSWDGVERRQGGA